MNLKNRIEKMEANASTTPRGLSVLQLANEAINQWRQGRGLSPVVVPHENIEYHLRQMPADRLVSLYQDCLGIGPRYISDSGRFRDLPTDELMRRYAEVMGGQ